MKIATFVFSIVFSLVFSSAQAQEQEFKDVVLKITNISNALYIAPMAVASHSFPGAMFDPGTAATPGVEAMAEIGNITPLGEELAAAGAIVTGATNEALALAPGESVYVGIAVGPGFEFVSLAGMILPTNDGFVGLNSYEVPLNSTGQITLQINGYDAGTEINNEKIDCINNPPFLGDPLDDPDIPVDPGGNNGTCGSGLLATMAVESPLVHVHPGNVGDTEQDGGISDLDTRIHRFMNPVAQVTVFY